MPILLDGTFKLTESRAIAAYLVAQHGKTQEHKALYPEIQQVITNNCNNILMKYNVENIILQDRARVNEMLFYDANVINRRFQDLMVSE